MRTHDNFIVVWSGTMDREGTSGLSLVPARPTKITDLWVGPKRIYNKKSAYWLNPRTPRKLDKVPEPVEIENEAKDGRDEAMVLRNAD